MFFSQYFSFPLSVSFHHCSIFIHLSSTLYNVFLPVLQFSPVSIIPPLLHTHSFTYTFLYQKDKRATPVNLPKSNAFSDRDVKVRAVPLQAWSCPEFSRNIRFPDFMTTAQDGGKVVSLTHRPLLLPGNTSGTHLEAESTPGPKCDRKDYVTEKFQ